MAKKNGRQETLLTQALTEIALEDTRHLKDRMMFDPALDDTAEALHRENRKRISALIQKNLGKKRRQGWMMLPAAACLALLLLGTLKLLKAPEDHTLRPGPTQIALTVLPGGTQTPAPTGHPPPRQRPRRRPPQALHPALRLPRLRTAGLAPFSRRVCRKAFI